jgi:NAD(P)-dependent dehydrogenase (short-subunit alcohol dehydrogenase family)
MNTSHKVIVVTGASQGIGAEVVKAFRKLDYRVVATARSIKPSEDPNIVTVAGDIADPDTARRVISEAVKHFGRVDTLVNNAGIFVAKPFTSFTAEDYATVMGLNMNIVNAIVYLESAPFVTGEILHVDGGQSAGH